MFSILSLLSGAALAGLVYGFSFLPSATLARCDDIECADEDRTVADVNSVREQTDGRQNTNAA